MRSISRVPRCQQRNNSRLRRSSRPPLDRVGPVILRFQSKRQKPGRAGPGTVVTLEVTVDRHRPTPARNPRAPHLVYASDETGDVVLTYFRAQPGYVEKLLPVGSKRYVSGTAQMYDGTLQLTHPDRVVD